MMLSAATATDNATRDLLVDQVHSYAAADISVNNRVLTAFYDLTFGWANNILYSTAGVNS